MNIMLMQIADWHGEQAADAYRDISRFERQAKPELAKESERTFERHTRIADEMWRSK